MTFQYVRIFHWFSYSHWGLYRQSVIVMPDWYADALHDIDEQDMEAVMISTQHTGVVVSAKEADAWHAEIKKIMADTDLTFGDAVNAYISRRAAARPVKIDAA